MAGREKPLWERRGTGRTGKGGSSPVVVREGPDGEITRLTGRSASKVTSQLGKPKTPPPPPVHSAPWRFRFHLIPFGWLAAAGAALAAHHRGLIMAGILGSAVVAASVVLLTRHLPRFPRTRTQLFAAWLLLSALVWSVWGLVGFPSWLILVAWAVQAGLWVRHYGWRPASPAGQQVRVDMIRTTWRELAEKNKWQATLGPGKPIPSGMQYPVICVGTHTHIGDITSKPQQVAAAYDQPLTQAYVEQHPSGIQSRGIFTMLERGTLEETRLWAGAGIDRDSGLAVVGRFPDGKDVHETYYTLGRDGISHTIVAGHMGSGKTAFLDLGLAMSATSGIICPVILDPQMGQALPAWREHVTYACGPDECMKYLRGFHAAMMDRSEFLGSVIWVDERGNRRKGMGFFNPYTKIIDPETGQLRELGLPIIELTIDEAPILLAIKGAAPLILDIAKLGRKVGFRLRIAAQVPSLAELKAQELRSMLVGSNVFCLRTGDKVTGGYVGITGNPNLLPKFFPDGSKTYGLGYCDTVDARPATPFRTDLVPDIYEVAETTHIRGLDDRAAAKVAEILAADDATVAQLAEAADQMAGLKLTVLNLLREPASSGELLAALIPDGHAISAVNEAVSQLAADRRIREAGGRWRVAG